MKRTAPFFFILVFIFVASVSIRAQSPSPTASPVVDDEVVKITTKLVQIDLLVVDKDGKQVRDLSASDFEVLQDGKPQKITNFSYVDTETGRRTAKIPVTPRRQTPNRNIPMPPVRVDPQNTGRVLTFIVDDGNCSATHLGMTAAKEALQKFIREQMLPTDRVAIYRTRTGSSVLQQYTNDKEQLLKIAGKIRWLPASLGCDPSDGSFNSAARSNTYDKPGGGTNTIESENERRIREANEDANRSNRIVGTLGLFSYVVNGLERISGRKLLFVLSDDLSMFSRAGATLRSSDAVRDFTELANRASVVINTIDVRGVTNPGMIEARDEVRTKENVNATGPITAGREKDDRNRRSGMAYLADETGGTFYQGQNYLDVPIAKALNVEKGYYLIAYEPDADTFKGKKYNRIEIKVSRPGLRVISRAGFVGVANSEATPKRRTGDSELYEAIAAPLAEAGLNVRLTAYFANSAAEGNVVRSLFHLDGGDLTFADAPGGQKKIVLDVVAVTLSEKNEVIDEFTRSHTLKFDAAGAAVIARDGLIYAADVPVKKPGTYNFRVAVRDATSQTLGSSSQIIQIPDLRKNGLFVSGLTISGVDAAGKFQTPGATKVEDALSVAGSLAVPAIRRFKRGSIVAYAYTIYNARLDKTTNRPKLTTQMNLYRDGQLVVESPFQNADFKPQSDWSRINDFSYVKLVDALTAGDYALQIVVSDELGGKNAVSSQWVDFEIVD
ncbi:MAG: VWA domain-containing protein [Pyrinomonadaceae bacterium]